MLNGALNFTRSRPGFGHAGRTNRVPRAFAFFCRNTTCQVHGEYANRGSSLGIPNVSLRVQSVSRFIARSKLTRPHRRCLESILNNRLPCRDFERSISFPRVFSIENPLLRRIGRRIQRIRIERIRIWNLEILQDQ